MLYHLVPVASRSHSGCSVRHRSVRPFLGSPAPAMPSGPSNSLQKTRLYLLPPCLRAAHPAFAAATFWPLKPHLQQTPSQSTRFCWHIPGSRVSGSAHPGCQWIPEDKRNWPCFFPPHLSTSRLQIGRRIAKNKQGIK